MITIVRKGSVRLGDRKGTWTIVSQAGHHKWNAVCECGREAVTSSGNWRARTRICKCIRTNYNQLPEGEASFNLLFGSYKRKASQRGLKFSLTREGFRQLTKQPCGYCGKPPSQTRKTTTGSPYVYTGIDRIDTKQGYVPGNVAPCCRYCNQSKSDLTLAEWCEHIRTLYERMCS